MKKLYERNELLFAILCIVSVPIRGSFGDESIAMLIGLAVIAAGALIFVSRSLKKRPGPAGDYNLSGDFWYRSYCLGCILCLFEPKIRCVRKLKEIHEK